MPTHCTSIWGDNGGVECCRISPIRLQTKSKMRLNVSVDQNTAVTAVNSPVLAILTILKNVCVEPSDFRSYQAHAHLSQQSGLANAGCASQK